MAGSNPMTAANGYSNPNMAPLNNTNAVIPQNQSYTEMMLTSAPPQQPVAEQKGFGGK